MATLNPNTFIGQIRLKVGDTNKNDPYMDDSVYAWFYTQNGNSVIDASIAALESLINQIALNPTEWDVGDLGAKNAVVATLERRLSSLRSEKAKYKAPVVISSDRKNWNDFNKAFGEDC